MAPDGTGLIVSRTDGNVADFLVGIATPNGFTTATLSVSDSDSYIQAEGDSGLSLAAPFVIQREGQIAFALTLASDSSGTSTTSSWASRSWLDSYADWFNNTFGSGWSEAAGGVIHDGLTLVMEEETLANTSDGALLTGTVIVSVPVAVGIVYGGEVALGVGTFGGGTTLIGSTAVVSPGLGAGTYPALVIDGTVYVARFHNIAWQLTQPKPVWRRFTGLPPSMLLAKSSS